MYTPSATQKFEQKVKNAFLENYRLEKLLEKPIKVLIVVEIEPPKSLSKKKRFESAFNIHFQCPNVMENFGSHCSLTRDYSPHSLKHARQ